MIIDSWVFDVDCRARCAARAATRTSEAVAYGTQKASPLMPLSVGTKGRIRSALPLSHIFARDYTAMGYLVQCLYVGDRPQVGEQARWAFFDMWAFTMRNAYKKSPPGGGLLCRYWGEPSQEVERFNAARTAGAQHAGDRCRTYGRAASPRAHGRRAGVRPAAAHLRVARGRSTPDR
jgi:hypothetical protein